MPTKLLKEIVEFFGRKLDNMSVEIKGAEVVTIKGKDGKDGRDGADSTVPGPQGEPGVPGVPGKDGKPGRDGKVGKAGKDGKDGKDGRPGTDGKDGKDGSPDTGEAIIRKVNHDESDLLIRKGKVEGMDEMEQQMRTIDANMRHFSTSGSFVYAYDLSSQLNGVLKTFTLPANAHVILAFGSSAPGVFRPTTDYTTTASTITFTSEITAAASLATGQTVVLLYKIL